MSKTLAIAVVVLFSIGVPSTQADMGKGEKAFSLGNYAVALREWWPLAEQGVAEAQSNLGHMYKLGLGVPQDYAAAVVWYRRASDQGNVKAQHNVGSAFYTGKGVLLDHVEAAHWFRKAADRGHFKAQFNLGLMYAKGEGVPSDNVRAYKWFFLAASRARLDKNHHRMVRALFIVAKRMTRDQITEARRLIREWKASSTKRA